MEKHNFTPDELKEIHRLYDEEKLSKKKVGEKFGVSEIVIVRVFKEQHWSGRKQGKSAKLSDEAFKRLVDEDVSDKEIGIKYGLTKLGINYRRRQLGMQKRHGPVPKLPDSKLCVLLKTQNISDISKKFYGISFSTSLRKRAMNLGCYKQDSKWIEQRTNVVHYRKQDGYYVVYVPCHPRASKSNKGYIQQHIYLWKTTLAENWNMKIKKVKLFITLMETR